MKTSSNSLKVSFSLEFLENHSISICIWYKKRFFDLKNNAISTDMIFKADLS